MMEESRLLRKSRVARSHSSQQVDLVDDECSTDSGCSSGGSTGSAEVLSRRGSVERHYQLSTSGGGRSRGRSTSGQERLKQRKAAVAADVLFSCKSSRSWSPEEKGKFRCHSILKLPSHSQSSSDTPSSDSDSMKRSSTARNLRKAFQSLKISTSTMTATEKNSNNEKKCQKRILRSPVAYTYVKGLSGLPTQRIPRNAV